MNFLPALPVLAMALWASQLAAQPRNVRISSPGKQPEEVAIAVNPTDPQNIVVGANLDYVARSTDGGATWTEEAIGSPFGVWGDPSIIFDPNGTALLAHLSNPANGYWLDRLVVHRSTDGGATWNTGAPIATAPPKQHDKEWMIADFNPGPRHGALYLTWTQFDHYGTHAPADSSRILCSRSSDGGLTWAAPVTVSDTSGDCVDSDSTVQGAVPAVGPNGDVYVTWCYAGRLYFDRSTDGGASFGTDRFLDTQPGGWDLAIPGLQRANGFPITLCDLSSSPRRGMIYVVWGDQRNGPEDTDVFLRTSTDGGATWSERRRVNQDRTKSQQFLPWATIDRATGDLWVVYYDRRAGDGLSTDVYAARSRDGGRTFTETRVSQASFTPDVRTFLGDYIGIDAFAGTAHAAWTRMDSGRTTLWTAAVGDSAITSVDGRRAGDAALHIACTSNAGTMRIDVDLPSGAGSLGGELTVDIIDLLGRRVRELREGGAGEHRVVWWNGLDDAGREASEGSYMIRARIGRYSAARRAVWVR